jgi:Fur family transcriptional regulator, ferric uptake regulator
MRPGIDPGSCPTAAFGGVDRSPAGFYDARRAGRAQKFMLGRIFYGKPVSAFPGNALEGNLPKPNHIEAQCVAKGMRMTEQRRVIARVLAGAADHPDVEELYRRCHEVDRNISISTVYRTVKLFEDAGIIERHDFREGRARYEQIPEAHHDHLINLRTGEVIEFQSEEIERLQAEIARRLGYRLVDHRLELYAVPLDDEKRR